MLHPKSKANFSDLILNENMLSPPKEIGCYFAFSGGKMKKSVLILVLFILSTALPTTYAADSTAYRSGFTSFDYTPVERAAGAFACYNKITSTLKNRRVLNIGVALGYSDLTDEHIDLVTDGFTLNTLNKNLTNRCVYENQGFCAFNLIDGGENQVNHFTRELKSPDGDDITVNIYTMNSSYSIGNYDNKTKFKDLQDLKTQTAKNFYAWALTNTDVVFYEGHSRDGGGPDFAPPRPTRSGTVNYAWYHAHKPGLKFLLSALDSTQDRPMAIGLFSCASKGHFLKSLQKHSPESKLILSTKVVEAYKTKMGLMRTLESILNFECDSDLKARIRDTSFVVN
jgi:hypothetical protein